MGLSVRARQAVFGEDGCLKTIRAGNCGVLLVDSGASAATQKRYRDACSHAGAEIRLIPQGMLLDATGRPGMAMAVLPGGLAQQITGLLAAADPIQSANNCGGASVE